MILDLVRKLSSIDSGFELTLNYSDDGVYSFTVESKKDGFGTIYSYSSTDSMECYNKIVDFINCLEDEDKFYNLLHQIEFEPLGV